MIVVMPIRSVVYPPLIGVGGIIHALGKNASMWWVIALAVAVLVSLVAIIFKIAVPKFKIVRTVGRSPDAREPGAAHGHDDLPRLQHAGDRGGALRLGERGPDE